MDFQWWHVGAAANVVITIAYLAIAYSIVRRLIDEAGDFATTPSRRRPPPSS